MPSPERVSENPSWPNIKAIKELQGKGFISRGSPLWWSTGHTPDPREYISLGGFIQRLVHVGSSLKTSMFPSALELGENRDIYLYPKPTVPMTILVLDIDGQSLPFLVTARPYNKKEMHSYPYSNFLGEHPDIRKLPGIFQPNEKVALYNHFYPHIRGLFAGKRGEHFFWYQLRVKFRQPIENALRKKELTFLDLYIDDSGWGGRTYADNWRKLSVRKDLVDLRNLLQPDFKYEEVSAEEFISGYHKDRKLIVRYPIQIENFDCLSTLIISNRTHAKDVVRKPAVLGIYVKNGGLGSCCRSGIARIKNRALAEDISRRMTEDFRIPVDSVLFTPQKGRPKYERVEMAK